MSRIPAAGNIIIEIEPEYWRLLISGNMREHIVVEAAPGQAVRYVSSFADTRRLPEEGRLETTDIQRVVAGWSSEDQAWHLGLVLNTELARTRGSRWVELARWADSEAHAFHMDSSQAGQALSRAIARPFDVIPPKVSAEGAPEPAAPAPNPPPLAKLPLQLGIWTLEEAGAQALQFTRSGQWARSKMMRILWYTFWVAIYIILAVSTLTSGIALPRPEFLPYLGLISGAILIGMIAQLFYELTATPNRILVDTEARAVRALSGDRERWRIPADDIEAVYITQVVGKPGRKNDDGKGKSRAVNHGELNLYLRDDTFCLLVLQQQPGDQKAYDPETAEEGVQPLQPQSADTDLQSAALYVARALDVPGLYDRRLK